MARGGRGGADDGQTAMARLVLREGSTRTREARIEVVLGSISDSEREIVLVSSALGQGTEFPAEVLAECERVAFPPDRERYQDRLDLRRNPLFTIDGPTAQDFDDAVGIVTTRDGRTRLIVAIADVSHYVREDSYLDLEARARGTSVYLPGTCLPMIPPLLSNDVCCLQPDQDRFAVAVLMELDGSEVTDVRVTRAVIRSAARLTYGQVQDYFDGKRGALGPHTRRLGPRLKAMQQLASRLIEARRARMAIDLELAEPVVEVDAEGIVTRVRPSSRKFAHRLIEEFMLLANEQVARFLDRADWPGVFRAHAPPDPAKLEMLVEQLEACGADRPKGGSVPEQPGEIAAWLDRILAGALGHQKERFINFAVLRSLMQAEYSAVDSGHFALALDSYLHFTSPIRRYPDLVTHRMVKRVLDGERPGAKGLLELHGECEAIADHCSHRERLAVDQERMSISRHVARYMLPMVGEAFPGTVTAVTGFGLFVLLDEPFVEGLIHVRSMHDDYELDEERMRLVGWRDRRGFTVGDRLLVRVTDASPALGRLTFGLEGRL